MPSTYSTDLRIELIANGDQSGVWGNTTNNNLGTLIEDAISGLASVSITSANQALTAFNGVADQSRCAAIVLTTTTTADFAVYAPPVTKLYVIRNDSSYTATIYCSTVLGNTTAAGTGVAIPAGKSVLIRSTGVNVVEQVNYVVGGFGVGGDTTIQADLSVTGAAAIGTTQAAAISVSSPAVITVAASPAIDTPVAFNTTGSLPTGLSSGTTYYVLAAGWTATSFRVSTSIGGSAVNTSAVGSGTHTVHTVVTAPTAATGTLDSQVATTTFASKTALAGGKFTGAIDYATPTTLASAATTNIGAEASNVITVSGTTTITSFGTATSGTTRTLTFSGSLTLTYNATSLILPGSTNIVTQPGDVGVFQSLGGGNWQCVSYTPRVIQYSLKGTTYLTTGTAATYTTPANVRALKVTVIGGGGGGGGVNGSTTASTNAYSGGGGGGGYATAFIPNAEASYTYTVGAGGAGGLIGANNGTAGGTTEFKNAGSTIIVSATGGAGGLGDSGSTSTGATAGAPGVGSITGLGTPGGVIGSGSGEYVTGYGRFINGQLYSLAGSGFCPIIGGGVITAASATGINATNYGEGGGNVRTSTAVGTDYAGGNGFQGLIIVEEYY